MNQGLQLDVSDLLDMSEDDLARRIANANGVVKLSLTVSELYRANTRTELAQNWLILWYTSECLAEHATSATCTAREGDRGDGLLLFDLATDDPASLASDLMEFAAVHGGEDLETPALVHDEAEEWVKSLGDSPVWFSGLQQTYRDDAALAAEFEGYTLEGDTE